MGAAGLAAAGLDGDLKRASASAGASGWGGEATGARGAFKGTRAASRNCCLRGGGGAIFYAPRALLGCCTGRRKGEGWSWREAKPGGDRGVEARAWIGIGGSIQGEPEEDADGEFAFRTATR